MEKLMILAGLAVSAAPDFPSGEFFARATRTERGDDVCPRDDSRVIEIHNFLP